MQAAVDSRTGFTSENFKIELRNLPKFFGINEAKKLFRKHNLSFHKLKPVGKRATYMFVNFKCEEDRDKAMQTLDGVTIKGRKISAVKAKAAKDPMVKLEQSREEDKRTVEERLFDAVCPFAKVSYQNQLEEKKTRVESLMKTLSEEVKKHLKFAPKFDALVPEIVVETVVESPSTEGYRNKCEFSVGFHPETEEIVVGFRLASYKKGSVSVAPVANVPVVSERMKQAASRFEAFVKESKLKPYDNITQSGVWKQLTVRESKRTKELMIMVVANPSQIPDKEALKEELKKHFVDTSTSVFVQFFNRKGKGEGEPEPELIGGRAFLAEQLSGLLFHVSPLSFFQINTEGAELLYSKAGDLAEICSSRTTLFDVCCGTGTIGLALAARCKKIVGVELVEDAVKNAKENAVRNGVEGKAQFYCGRAEHLLPDLLKKYNAGEEDDMVAIVDPPRAGLHPKAVQALRASAKLKKLVYISCDAKAAMNNFVSLAKPTSNGLPGDPFVPVKAIPVDLFPHTRHFELIILFERISMNELLEK